MESVQVWPKVILLSGLFCSCLQGFSISGQVEIPGTVVQISAGESHSAALTTEGKVYYWGTFRAYSSRLGLTPDGKDQPLPIPLAHDLKVTKIASGILWL